jgi:hypothetical protein
MNIPLEIFEVDYNVSPNGVNSFEIYDVEQGLFDAPPVYETDDLTKAVRYCYDLGLNFTVRPLAHWEQEQKYNV